MIIADWYLDNHDISEFIDVHPPTNECPDSECMLCGYRDCPHHDILHYHHDGCPSCMPQDVEEITNVINIQS